MTDASKLIYKNIEFKIYRKFIEVVEEDIGEELTPSILHTLFPGDDYTDDIMYILKNLKCSKEFNFNKFMCEKMIEEFKYYDKKLLLESYVSFSEEYYEMYECDPEHCDAIVFVLFCKPTNCNFFSAKINKCMYDSIHRMIVNVDMIEIFIDYTLILSSIINENIFFIDDKSIDSFELMYLFLKKTNDHLYNNYGKQTGILIDLYCEYHYKIKDTKYLSKMSYEYLERYFRYAVGPGLEKNKLWRNKILKRICEDKNILNLFINNILNKLVFCDRECLLCDIYHIIKDDVELLHEFFKYRHHQWFLAYHKIYNIYLDLVGHEPFANEINFMDLKRLFHPGCEVLFDCLRRCPSLPILIYKYKKSFNLGPHNFCKVAFKLVRNVSILFILLRKGGPLIEINLLKPILSYVD